MVSIVESFPSPVTLVVFPEVVISQVDSWKSPASTSIVCVVSSSLKGAYYEENV
jgi:hypothetical protein